jgi:hypothetical protein
MRIAKRYAVRLSSTRCSTCEDPRWLKARIEATLRNACNLYRAAGKALDSAALRNLEEEPKQILAALKLICYAVHVYPTDPNAQTRCLLSGLNGPGKE